MHRNRQEHEWCQRSSERQSINHGRRFHEGYAIGRGRDYEKEKYRDIRVSRSPERLHRVVSCEFEQFRDRQ